MCEVGQINFAEQIEEGEPEFKQTDSFSSVLLLDEYGKPFGRKPHEVELLEYTGLKDKNGVEIYEGYILKRYGSRKLRVVTWGTVTQSTGFNIGSRAVGDAPGANWEVIGNIHQSPQLLEGRISK